MREIVRHLALIALLLRALVPAGWMPGTGAAAPLVICSVHGPTQYTQDGDIPVRGNPTHHDACPFAAAPHFAKTLAPLPLGVPALRILTAWRSVATPRPGRFSRYQPQSTRAPPTSA